MVIECLFVNSYNKNCKKCQHSPIYAIWPYIGNFNYIMLKAEKVVNSIFSFSWTPPQMCLFWCDIYKIKN